MRSLGLVLAVAGLLAAPGARADTATTNTTVLPKQFIIEVASNSTLAALTAEVQALGATVNKVYDSTAFTGVSVQGLDGNVNSLQTTIGAASSVWPSRRIQLQAKPVPAANATASLKRRNLRRGASSAADTLASQAASPLYSVHGMTGVDTLHAAGIKGKGVQVALIDTGVEYTHPALGGCFGAGCKIAGGYDFVGDGCWPEMGCEKAPDGDPNDLFGVGTSLAGVILGEDDAQGFTGVAPEATIYAYKVFTSDGITDDETLIEAFLMAYHDGADVISANVVGPGGFLDDPLALIASRLVDAGVVVTMAAGDYGDDGLFYASAGASGSKVLAVAALEATLEAASYFDAVFTVDGQSSTASIAQYYFYNPMPPNRNGWPILPLTMDTTVADDACAPLVGNYTQFHTALALVRLGGCNAQVKQANLIAAGVQNILFYWDPSTWGTEPLVTRYASFVLFISDTAGEAIVHTWQQGGTVTANFTVDSNGWRGLPDGSGRKPLLSSSWGPLYDLRIKPDIAAPGGHVLSTYIDPYTWLVQSGSSLASAYVAGVAALYIGQHGGRKSWRWPPFSASDLAMRIISSGAAVPDNANADYSASVALVGTGLVNAAKVLDYSTQLSYTKLELNDTRHFQPYHAVQITNNARHDVAYTFAMLPAAGYETWQDGALANRTDMAPIALQPYVTLPSTASWPWGWGQSGFTVRAGSSRAAEFSFFPPHSAGTLPLYSGAIQINSSLGESLTVPYLGLNADLGAFFRSSLVPSGYPYIVSGRKSLPIASDNSWSFDLSLGKQDFPKLHFRNAFGCDELRWDIFDAHWTERDWVYPPVVGRHHYLGSATYWEFSSSALIYDPADSDYEGTSTAFPVVANQRMLDTDPDAVFWWLGPLANGQKLAPGQYTMRVAALLPFGDRRRSDGWNTPPPQITISFLEGGYPSLEITELQTRDSTERRAAFKLHAMERKSPESSGQRQRSGCLTCRDRKKRCDQNYPICDSCRRLNFVCRRENPRHPRKPGRPAAVRSGGCGGCLTARVPDLTTFCTQNDNNPPRRLFLRYYTQGLAVLITTNLANNGFLSVFLPLAMDAPPFLDALVAWSATHLALRDATFHRLALQCRGTALRSLAASLAAPQRQPEVELACCLVHCALESIAGDTRQWYTHIQGAHHIIRSVAAVAPRLDLRAFGSFEGQWLIRSFAYHDIMATVTEDRRPLLVAGHYWLFDPEEPPDSLYGLASRVVYLVSETSLLNVELLRAGAEGRTTSAALTCRYKNIEAELLAWRCPTAKRTQPDELVVLAEMYRSAAVIHLGRVARRRNVDDVCGSTVQKTMDDAVTAIVDRLCAVPERGLAESSLLFPLFLAGGETSDAQIMEQIRHRMQDMVDFRHFHNVAVALDVLEELWHLRLSGRDVDWRDVLDRRGWMLSMT